jgi:hypothetical protein
MNERLLDPGRVLRLVVLMTAVLGATWAISMSLAPEDLAAQQDEPVCVKCHTPDPVCISCHSPEVSPGDLLNAELDLLEYDSKLQCVFNFPGPHCATVTRATCAGFKAALQFLSGEASECVTRAEAWVWM